MKSRLIGALAVVGLVTAGFAATRRAAIRAGAKQLFRLNAARAQAQPIRILVPTRAGAFSQTYEDPIGDAVNGAPDIQHDHGHERRPGEHRDERSSLANQSSDFKPNEGVIVVDGHRSERATGRSGIDYVYAGVKDHDGLFEWNGSSFGLIKRDDADRLERERPDRRSR